MYLCFYKIGKEREKLRKKCTSNCPLLLHSIEIAFNISMKGK